MIVNAPDDEVISIMYDTTTRKQIEGEWIAFLIYFGKQNITLRLRSLPFLFEDRDNIVALFVEQISRLAMLVDVHPTEIWKKISSIMTDSVSKNLKIGERIADILYAEVDFETKHIPHQLLCSAHWCENIDKKCLEVCMDIEQKMKLKDLLLRKMPSLSAFIRGKKSIVEFAIEACCSIVLNTGKKSSMYKSFLNICQIDDVSRKVGAYKQRRFARLGHCAGSIVHHLSQFKTLVSKLALNQHGQAVKLYLDQPFIIDAMICLSKVSEFLTLPYLEMVQKTNQEQLLQIFSNLYNDLKNNNIYTLKDFHTPYNFNYPPSNPQQENIIHYMTKAIAEGFNVQRGREYNFGVHETREIRATNIAEISPSILPFLPTHNLDCERELGIFDHKLSKIHGGFNAKSTFKGIRDEMMLYKTNICTIPRDSHKKIAILDHKEQLWLKSQKEKESRRTTEKHNSEKKMNERWMVLLNTCKTWGGPFTDMEQVCDATKLEDKTKLKKILRTEISINKIANFHPHLDYSVNSKSIEQLQEILENIIAYEQSVECDEKSDYSEELFLLSNKYK